MHVEQYLKKLNTFSYYYYQNDLEFIFFVKKYNSIKQSKKI